MYLTNIYSNSMHGHSVALKTSEMSDGVQNISVYNLFGTVQDPKAI